jgi:hypothetical protein
MELVNQAFGIKWDEKLRQKVAQGMKSYEKSCPKDENFEIKVG